MEKKRVGYVGPFCDNNFGDFGMLVNDVYDIGASDIVIFSYNEKVTENIISVYLADIDNVKLCNVKLNKTERIQTGKHYKVEYDEYDESPFEIICEVDSVETVEREVMALKALIVTGGGWLNDVWCAKHRKDRIKAIMAPVLIAAKHNIPVIYMGNTYGPFNRCKSFFRNFFSYTYKNSIYACRDDYNSVLNMKSLGIEEIYSIPDDLYFLNRKLWEEKPGDIVLRYIENGPYIIIENYLSLDELECNLSKLREFVNHMKKSYNLRVLFLPLGDRYGGAYQAEFLQKHIPNLDIWMIEEDVLPRICDIETLIKNAQFVLCQRYHMLVRSLANNIPVRQVLKDVCGDKNYYYTKAMGILSKIFNREDIQEREFLGLDFWDELSNVQQNYRKYVTSINSLLEKKIKDGKEQKIRQQYIDKILNYIK